MKHSTLNPGRRASLRWMAAAGLTANCPTWALAQDTWPSRPVRMVHSSPAGSGADVLARIFAEQLTKALGQTVYVENKAGANGQLAVGEVVRAKPDGYTLLFASASATVLNQAVQPKLPYNVLTDLEPIAQIGSGGILMVVTPDFPAQNLQQFIAEAKAHPGKYNYASWGVGSTGHVTIARLELLTGIKLNHVAYKSVPTILGEMQAGIIKVAMVDVTSAIALVKLGKLRALAITGTQKLPQFPDVPTMAEQGVPMTTDGWYGMFAPAGTSKDIITRLNGEINKSLRSPDLRDRFTQLNMIDKPPLTTPEQFTKTMKTDYETWAKVVKVGTISLN